MKTIRNITYPAFGKGRARMGRVRFPGEFFSLLQSSLGIVTKRNSPLGERNPSMFKLSGLNQAKRDGALRSARRGHALSVLVLVLGGMIGRTEIYAIDPTDTFYGTGALGNVTTGFDDSAFGYYALSFNTTGYGNTASGVFALRFNTTGNYNTASGVGALEFNNIGNYNTASGASALYANTTGVYNTASGASALSSNTGSFNTASGASALYANTTGAYNTANGFAALGYNTTGSFNTADGLFALENNTTGSNNVAIGTSAGTNLTTGSGNIDIGNAGVAAESNTIRIGASQSRAFVAGVRNAVVPGGAAVYAAANGQLGTNPSSERFKHEISDMGQRSEGILALRPVSFRYQKELDANQVAQFGLLAEEVAKVDPDLVVRDEKGELYSVRYEAVNAMLLNEFLKEHRTVQEQEAIIAHLKSAVSKQEATAAQQQKQIEALTAGLQKVSAQLEVSKAAPETVLNNH